MRKKRERWAKIVHHWERHRSPIGVDCAAWRNGIQAAGKNRAGARRSVTQYKRWTASEDAQIVRLCNRGLTGSQVAYVLRHSRPAFAVLKRITKLRNGLPD